LMKQVYGDDCLSRSRVHEWFQRFQNGREDIYDDEHVGQPKSVITENSIETVREFIKNQTETEIIEIHGNIIEHLQNIDLSHFDRTFGVCTVCSAQID